MASESRKGGRVRRILIELKGNGLEDKVITPVIVSVPAAQPVAPKLYELNFPMPKILTESPTVKL